MLSTRLYRTIMIGALAVVTIYYAQVIVMPIIFSALCAMLVHPLVKRFESWGINLVFSSLFVVILVTGIIAGLFTVFLTQGLDIVKTLPIDQVETVVEHPVQAIDNNIDVEIGQYKSDIYSMIERSKKSIVKTIPKTLSNLNALLVFLISCPIYIFFMLITRSSIRKFYYACFSQPKKKIANRILCQIEMVYINYLKGMLYVVLIVSTLTTIGLFFLGIPHAIFIGILSGILTLVPYVGVIVGALIPLSIALLTKDSLWYPAGVIMIYALVQFLEGNIITPKIMGDQVGINPLLVILGIIIFGAIGGILGMVLTIPILALLKVISAYIPGWKPLRYLLQV